MSRERHRSTCAVCGSPAAVAVSHRQDAAAARGRPRRPRVPQCTSAGRAVTSAIPRTCSTTAPTSTLEDLTERRAASGRPDRPGREFHMAQMAIDILGRDDLEVLVFGAGRSFDNRAHRRAAAGPPRRHRRRDAAARRCRVHRRQPARRRAGSTSWSRARSSSTSWIRGATSPISSAFVEPDGLLVCSTNLYDGGLLATPELHLRPGSHLVLQRALAGTDRRGQRLPARLPRPARRDRLRRPAKALPPVQPVAGGHGGDRPILQHARSYAPSESPTANRELAAAREARLAAERPVRPGG